MILAPFIRQRFFSAAGAPLAGGKLYSYVAGTTTNQATYTDQGGGTPNANPVVLDANGEANIWVDPTLAYKFVLKDSSGNTQWTVDQVSGAGLTGLPQWNANSNYSSGNIVADDSGAGLLYVSITDNNLGNALTSVANWRLIGGSIRTLTSNTTLLVTDEFIRSNSTSGSLTHTLPACSTTPIGKRIIIKDIGSGGHTTTVKGSGTDLVDGNNTYALSLGQYDSIILVNNGTGWDAGFILPDGVVTTAKLASGAVTGSKVAAATITSSNIAAATITGTNMASGVNLPGYTVQENNRNVVVAQTNNTYSLAIIRGVVDSNGTVISGEGFTPARNSAGNYNVAFTSAFSDFPSVTVTCLTSGTVAIAIPFVGNGGVNVITFGAPTGVTQDAQFSFIAIGQRALT